ncbi:hypothetical protein BWQ96_07358 [Gracilariopsis chorda]|uniref:Uncharacterized protein n=1 Tax=Gracilariopsis chorda TaxID=448386 RepID=A0A2V3ILF3_9FLOR|nr:hypothetical protein BWQ96_07358 [Gracilariopsis chorda]|eukprot:PXF42911.1 hypothetical protein BWQ96_07358 [Gracilariopsis chorda]
MHPPLTFVKPPLLPLSPPPKPLRTLLCKAPSKAPSKPPSKPPRRPPTRPRGYWCSLSNTLSELARYLDGSTTLPTARELEAAGRSDLAGALRRHGWAYVADKTGLQLASIARPRSIHLAACTPSPPLRMRPYMYWRNFDNLQAQLEPYIQNGGLPTAKQLLQAGRSELIRAISIHGGWKPVAKRMNVRPSSKPDWSDLSVVLRHVRLAAQTAGLSDAHLPGVPVLRRYGTRGLLSAIRTRHGGLSNIARIMSSSETPSPPTLRKPRVTGLSTRLETKSCAVQTNCLNIIRPRTCQPPPSFGEWAGLI